MNKLNALFGAALIVLAQTVNVQAQVDPPTQLDATRLRLAHSVLDASGGAEAMKARMRAMFAGIEKLATSSMPTSDAHSSALADGVMKYVVDEEVAATPQLVDQIALIYADNLSEEELRDMLAWTTSPSGRSIQAKMPIVSQQFLAAQGPLMKKIMSGAVQKAVDRACAQTGCTDVERKQLTSTMEKGLPSS